MAWEQFCVWFVREVLPSSISSLATASPYTPGLPIGFFDVKFPRISAPSLLSQ